MESAPVMIASLHCTDLLFSANCAPLSMTLSPGELGVVQLCDEESADLLLHTLIGLRTPTQGSRLLFGNNPETLPETGRHGLRRRVGIVADHCGLISNLTILENLLLPAEYTGSQDRSTLVPTARQLLHRVGYQGEETLLPGHLKLLQKRQVLLARALLLAPELMLYGTFLSGLSTLERKLLLDVALSFQAGETRTATLFLISDASLTKHLKDAVIYNLNKGENNDR